MSFDKVTQFENKISTFFGSKYAVATDSCTHALELCIRLKKLKNIVIPKRTYASIAMLSKKLNIKLIFQEQNWIDYYYINGSKIIDAAVYWKKNGYIKNTYMCLSFQYQKHLNIGKGGMILLDNYSDYRKLIRMSYDGRERNIPWRKQNIKDVGFHYYLTPESAEVGIKIFEKVKNKSPKKWTSNDYPDLSKMKFTKYI
tara:strand:- start:210 stop:806 length:597 start_codon:yes stop_codon:yes gene_type:complete